jgi:hypothetical protein
VNSIEDLVKLIARRDSISMEEAHEAVEDCIDNIRYVVENEPDYETVVGILREDLGLEPDYLDLILEIL